MRNLIALILLTALVALSTGFASAQDAGNATNLTNATNESAVAEAVPVAEAAPANVTEAVPEVAANASVTEAAPEAAAPASVTEAAPEATAPANETEAVTETAAPAMESRYKQLSVYTGTSQVLGKNEAQAYTDVSQSTDRKAVFTRDAGELSPSSKLGITKVGTGSDKYVQITSKAVGEWNLTGWSLSSADSTTFTFPAMSLKEGAVLRVHEGEGAGSETDIYTNSTTPLWTDNLISLLDAEGDVISLFDVSSQPAETKWTDPLANQIQY